MESLLENPSHIEAFEKMAVLDDQHIAPAPQRTSDHLVDSPFTLLQWHRDEEPQIIPAASVDELDGGDKWDLRIILAPMDARSCLPEYRKLVERYDIPTAFVSERLRNVTYSFGTRKNEDGSETVWTHFLAVFPPETTSSWVKSGLVLHSSPADTPHNDPCDCVPPSAPSRRVTLICFSPVAEFWIAINRVFHSDNWFNILDDPYLLISLAFESWYELTDDVAWGVNDSSREAEKEIFTHSEELADNSSSQHALDYTRIHRYAKDAIFLREGLDATLRSLDRAIQCHAETEKRNPVVWQATQDALLYRREMFHSTRLRTLSVEQRLKNVINLAFNIGSMRDSLVMQQDSYVMRTLSVLAMIFLPISTVGTIFGTQFFSTSSNPDPSADNGDATSSFHLDPQFWLLWAIAIPITISIVLGWMFWIRRSRLKASIAKWGRADQEAANVGFIERQRRWRLWRSG